MKKKAVIFDLDGTLIHTLEGIAFSMNSVLQTNGHASLATDRYRLLVGNGLAELVRKILVMYGVGENMLQKYLAEMLAEYRKSWDRGIRLYEGIADLLQTLHDGGIQCAVHTNKEESFAREMIGRLFPDGFFVCIAGNRPDRKRKPDPEGALYIAGRLGLQAEECLYVGDSEIDIQTARNAGMDCVSVSWGFRDPAVLREAGARIILQSPDELFSVLQKSS